MMHAQQCWAHVIFLSTCHAVLPMRHASPQCFFNVFSCVIAVSCHATYLFNPIQSFSPCRECSPLKNCFNTNMDLQPPFTPPGGQIPPSSLQSTSTLPPLLSLILISHPPPSPGDRETRRQGDRQGDGRQAERRDRQGDKTGMEMSKWDGSTKLVGWQQG